MPAVIVDIAFAAEGTPPDDHGYLLYSAVVASLPWIHDQPDVGLWWEPGAVFVRCEESMVPAARRIAGRHLEVGRRRLVLGAPTVLPIEAAPVLASPFVTAKSSATGDTMEAPELADYIRRRLVELEVDASFGLGASSVRRVKSTLIRGHEVRLCGLDEESSLLLQRVGLGGRRRMGAGVLSPVWCASAGAVRG